VNRVSDDEQATAAPTAGSAATLLAVCRRIFPHDALADGPYERWVASLQERAAGDPAFAGVLRDGLEALDADGRSFADLGHDEQLARLRAAAATPFFAEVRGSGVVGLYNDPEVWAFLGWEGASSDLGGYLHRGFDDLDWLPDAHDGSL
jgi:hypothetical protein